MTRPRGCECLAERGHRPFELLTDTTMVDLIMEIPEGGFHLSVPKQYLTAVSPYFDKALNGEWMESEENIIQLGKRSQEVLLHFVEWLSARKLFDLEGLPPVERIQNELEVSEERNDWMPIVHNLYGRYFSQYVFGDKFDVPQLRRDAIDAMSLAIFTTRLTPSVKIVSEAYKVLPEDSLMIKLLIDTYARTGTRLDYECAKVSDIPREFFADLAMEAMFPPVSQCTPCDYHEHN